MKQKPIVVMMLLLSALLPNRLVAQTNSDKMEIYKETHIFSVRGNDTLRLDKYDTRSPHELAAMQTKPRHTDRGVVLFASGGGFSRGHRDRIEYQGFFERLARSGYVVVSIDYRQELTRMGTKDFITPSRMMDSFYQMVESAMQDYCYATRFVVDHANEWGIDSRQIIACGSSAGAITVLQLTYEICGLNDKVLQWLPSRAFKYAAVVSFSGAICIKGERASIKLMPPPVMMVHGNQDAIVPFDKAMVPIIGGFIGSRGIFREMEGLDVPRKLIAVRGGNHEVAVLSMYRHLDAMLDFLKMLDKERDNSIPFDLERTIFPKPFKEAFPKVVEPMSHGRFIASYVEESPAEMHTPDIKTKRYTAVDYLINILKGFVQTWDDLP